MQPLSRVTQGCRLLIYGGELGILQQLLSCTCDQRGVDDKFKISYTNYGKTSDPLPQTHDIQIITMTNHGEELLSPPPRPCTESSKGHLTHSSCPTGSSCNITITTVVEHKPSMHPPPPPETGGGEHYLSPKPYVASA